jgi:hypothetical protein
MEGDGRIDGSALIGFSAERSLESCAYPSAEMFTLLGRFRDSSYWDRRMFISRLTGPSLFVTFIANVEEMDPSTRP